MANYYTLFSFEIDAITEQESRWISDLRAEQTRIDKGDYPYDPAEGRPEWPDEHGFVQFGEADAEYYGFDVELERQKDGDTHSLWIHADESGDPEHAAAFVQEFLTRFRPDTAVGFEWANTCSSPRTGAFGGGAVLVTATNAIWMASSNWLGKETANWLANKAISSPADDLVRRIEATEQVTTRSEMVANITKYSDADLEREIAFADGFGPDAAETAPLWIELLHAEQDRRLPDPDAIYVVMSSRTGQLYDDRDDENLPLYWSNEHGWTTADQATRFTEAETRTFSLPLGGSWAELALPEEGRNA